MSTEPSFLANEGTVYVDQKLEEEEEMGLVPPDGSMLFSWHSHLF